MSPVTALPDADPTSPAAPPSPADRLALASLALSHVVSQGAPGRRPFRTLIGFKDAAVQDAVAAMFAARAIPGVALPVLPEEPGHAPDLAKRVLVALGLRAGLEARDRLDAVAIHLGEMPLPSIDMFGTDLFCPAFLLCWDAPRNAAWSERRAALIGRGYVSLAATAHDEILIHQDGIDAPTRTPVHSFDIFDTLLARRCIDPWRVFAMVGERMGLPDFVDRRRAAEQRVLGRIYDFDDIYTELAADYGFDADRRAEVQACEMTCELDSVIPIAENLRRVRDGDLLLSDMYLGEAQIRQLLGAIGLDRSVGVLVSSHGKAGGLVWPKLTSGFAIRRHLGDNPHADGQMAQRAGLATELTATSAPNLIEDMLLQTGLVDLARLCREARLTTWHDDPRLRLLQVLQTSVNLPLLILASVHLSRRAVAAERQRLLFCSRDCNLWHPLFDIVQARLGLSFETRYFLTSRAARVTASEPYRRYAREQLGEAGMIVDLCGTGWSTARLAQAMGLRGCRTYLIDHHEKLAIYERKAATPDSCIVESMFKAQPDHNNITLEVMNYADRPMLLDMAEIDGALLPVYAPDLRTSHELAAVAAQHTAFQAGVAAIRHYGLTDTLDLDDESIALVCRSLYAFVSRQGDALNVFATSFYAENNAAVVRCLS